MLLLSVAFAQSAPWTQGLPLGLVEVVPLEGKELPDSNLGPLLRSTQGGVYDPQDVRADVALLYSTGQFEQVEALVEPWLTIAADGRPMPAVRLVYRVDPAPLIAAVEVVGAGAWREPEVSRTLGLVAGMPLDGAADLGPHEERIEEYYAELGFPLAEVHILRVEEVQGRVALRVEVEEGPPLILEGIRFGGDLPISEGRMRRIARREGLAEGRRVRPGAVRAAAEAMAEALRERGWLEARVTPAVPEGSRQVLFRVEPGPRVSLEAPGLSRAMERELWVAAALDTEARLNAAVLPDLEERLLAHLRERGWTEAQVKVELRGGAEELVFVVLAEPGPRHRLAPGGLSVEGAEHFRGDYLAGAMQEASPDVLGEGWVTPEALEAAALEVEELYRSEGFLQADLQIVEIEDREALRGHWIYVTVAVEEGPRTKLDSVELVGAAGPLEADLAALGEELEGQPLNPQALQALRQTVIEAHRAGGWLGADAELVITPEPDGAGARAVIRVDPGPQVVLRSVIVRGNRRIAAEVVRQQVPLATGDPITPEALGASRANLYDLGAFRVASVGLEGESDRVKDIVVELEEQPAWSVEVGGGFATDIGARAFVVGARNNLWGRPHRISAFGQVGVGWQGEGWVLDTASPEWRGSLRYDAAQKAHVDVLLNERDQQPTFRILRTGVAVGLDRDLAAGPRVNAELRLQRRQLDDVDPGAFVDGDPWLTQGDGTRPQAVAYVLMVDDRRDDPFNPTQGSLSSLELQVFDPITLGALGARGEARVQVAWPLGPLRFSVGARGGLGWVAGEGTTLPLEDRFRLGGAGSLRGFPLDQVGPRNEVANDDLDWPGALEGLVDYTGRDNPARWVPTGGDAMALVSLELAFPLEPVGWEGTSVVAFTDVGNTWLLDPLVFADSMVVGDPLVRYSVGLGLRQVTPIGPLRLDLGVNPAWWTEPWAAERGESPVRLHISLGAL